MERKDQSDPSKHELCRSKTGSTIRPETTENAYKHKTFVMTSILLTLLHVSINWNLDSSKKNLSKILNLLAEYNKRISKILSLNFLC